MFWKTGNSGHISSWESKGLLGTIIKPPTSFNSLPKFINLKQKTNFIPLCQGN